MYSHIKKSSYLGVSLNNYSSRRSVTLLNKHKSILISQKLINQNNLLNNSKSDNFFARNDKYLPLISLINLNNFFHTHSNILFKDPESKVEKTVSLLKENILNEDHTKKTSSDDKTSPQTDIYQQKTENESTAELETLNKDLKKDLNISRPSLWDRIAHELKHYYNGFKLLFLETKITFRLLKQILNGHTLTRRERRQLTRTAADLFRLVPFSVFIIVPFMEFTLPIFLKLFPNMLPSTFQEESKEQDKLKKKLKAKLEMAKFLQDTLEETSLTTQNKNVDSLNNKFGEFMRKVRSKGEQPTNDEIMKYSSLFENELTLENLNRQQLVALCQILDVSSIGIRPPNHILRFQLRMKIRGLETDDKVIVKEGIESLDIAELQQACRDRGMRSIGLSEKKLRFQLEQWLDLHLNRKIPLSLLLLSRALYLPENLPTEDIIKNTISVLPESIENATIAKIAEVSGGKVSNEIKLELLKKEETEIKLEKIASENDSFKETKKETIVQSPVPASQPDKLPEIKTETDFAAKQLDKEKLIDNASILSSEKESRLISPEEIKEINQLIENLPSNEKIQVKAEIAELKKDVTEYKEDIKEVEQLSSLENVTKLTETKSAKLLSKRVQKLISDMDKLIIKLEKNPDIKNLENKNAVSIEEILSTIKKIRGESNDLKEKNLIMILQSLDKDKDGKIDDLNDVLKVFDLIEQENVKISKEQLGTILTLLEKEKLIEIEEQKNQSNEADIKK